MARPLPHKGFKLNLDASLREGQGGLGYVIRDEKGVVIAAVSEPFNFTSILQGEAFAIRNGLLLGISECIEWLQVESNCQEVGVIWELCSLAVLRRFNRLNTLKGLGEEKARDQGQISIRGFNTTEKEISSSYLQEWPIGATTMIVGNYERPVFNGELHEGHILIVPQGFVVMKQSGDEGFEWVSFKTNENPKTNPLAGKTLVLRGMPVDILANAFRLSREEASRLKYNREEVQILRPRSHRSQEWNSA
ncbi:12S seed storage protein CRB-like [Telopea speciosissima]|uniref:12S seed storage protein CRB-like n=1 Tax=Telopea speciosissima TaxID=54955 RepID=UPI001CC4DD89|nr:12S seed storage protein CRB-like [Telopea speciosissima]